ncbi:MAG TPA: hypothetical protein DCS17_07780 [Flavobacterium sp.]|nr:hypothetical protein [Flavobacterium sp.]
MKLPFTISRKYKTSLTKNEIFKIIGEVKSEKLFQGIRLDKFEGVILENSFQLQRESFGLDISLENYPLVTCKIEKENPTVIELLIKPNYLDIAFFMIFVVTFISVAIFSDEITINDVLKKPDLFERVLLSLGGIIPGIWCYIGFIRPIKKTEKWIVEKLFLKEIY